MELYNPEGEISRQTLLEQEHYGEVVDIADPLNICSVKVRIPKILEGDIKDLPWVIKLSSTFQGNNAVEYGVPEIGQVIRVWFPWGDINKPVYGLDFVHENLYTNYFNKNSYGFIDSTKSGFVADKDVSSLTVAYKAIKLNSSSVSVQQNLSVGSGWTGTLACGNCLVDVSNGIIVKVSESF